MKKNILTAVLLTCTILFSKAQTLGKFYNTPETNYFTTLLLDENSMSLNNGYNTLTDVLFNNRIPYNTPYAGYTTSTGYRALSNLVLYPSNYINDSAFIYANDLMTPDTVCMAPDRTNSFAFNFRDHVVDYAHHKIYRLLASYKYNTAYGMFSNWCEPGLFIIKSAPLDSLTYYASQAPFNKVDNYYKVPDVTKNYKIYFRNANSIFLVGTDPYNNINHNTFEITELDSNLQVVHTRTIENTLFGDLYNYAFNNTCQFIGNKIYLTAVQEELNSGVHYYTGFCWEYDANFNALDSVKFNSYYEKENYFNSKKGNHYFYFVADSNTIIKTTNASNDTIRIAVLPTLNKVLITRDSSYIMLQSEASLYHPNGMITDIFAYNWDKNGNFINKVSLYDIGASNNLYDLIPPLLEYVIDSFNNIGYGYTLDFSGGSTIYKQSYTNFFNIQSTHFVSGKILNDINRNCLTDSMEIKAKNVLIELKLNGRSYFTLSDDSGFYRFTPFDTGHATLVLHLENQSIYTNACADSALVLLSNALPNPSANFLVSTPYCNRPVPKVSVDISTPFLRRCFDNLYTLTLTNESNDTAFNTYADVTLDTGLIATDAAFTSAENLGNHTYRFHFGMLAPLQTIHKNLIVNVDCSTTVLGQTHCVKAVSYPYERSCAITDGAYMQATAACRNDSVIFVVKNIGYPTAMDNLFRVIVNDTVNYQGYLHFSMSNSTQTLSYYNPEGKTYRLETLQFPAYPNEDSVLSVSIEGCGNTTFSTGYITMFAQDDDQPNVSIDCHQNRSSFDPNDKSANPVGYNDAHLIENTQAVEYTIHFQNLGTYAASYVTVTDTLSTAFDITTIHVIGASHDYTLSVIDSNILQFRFTNIELAAATDDSLLSNGFIKFSVKPKKNTAIGTAIHNDAFITFDFNEPVKTNTVQHEIGKDFLGVNLISAVKNNLHNDLHTKVYPNPFNQTATLSFDYKEATQLSILSPDGRIVQQLISTNNFYIINRNKLSSGTYIYELRNNISNELLDTGKLIIQ